jgi:hypothetical protein
MTDKVCATEIFCTILSGLMVTAGKLLKPMIERPVGLAGFLACSAL